MYEIIIKFRIEKVNVSDFLDKLEIMCDGDDKIEIESYECFDENGEEVELFK